MFKLVGRVFRLLEKVLAPVRDKLVLINKKLDKLFESSWLLASLRSKLSFIFTGLIGIVATVSSVLMAIANFGSLVDIVGGTVQGSSFWLEKLQNVIEGYPSFQSLIQSMDSQFAALDTYFTPPITFSYILQVTGIGDAVNSIIVCAVQGISFIISLRLMFWALGRVKIQMIKPIK